MRAEIEKSALGPIDLIEEGGQRSFQFGDDFIGFAGHFPGYPILPAVLQTLLAQMVAERLLGESLQFVALERAKFTQQLRPGDRIDVRVNCQEKKEQLHCHCDLVCAESRAASFILVLAKGLDT